MKLIFHSLLVGFLMYHHCLFAQVEIGSNCRFFDVFNDNYIIYFNSNTSEPDDFLEGKIMIYEVNTGISRSLNDETYILDFLDVAICDLGILFVSNGNSIVQYNLNDGNSEKIWEAESGCLISTISVSPDAINVVVSTLDQSSGLHRVVVFNRILNTSFEVYKIESSMLGEQLKIKTIVYDSTVFLLNFNGDLLSAKINGGSHKLLDREVLKLFYATSSYLYYAKEYCLLEYNLFTDKQFEILLGNKSLNFLFVDSYENGLFLSFNDNVFIYNKARSTFKKIEELPKNKYVYFSSKLAIFQGVNKSLKLIMNSDN